MTATKLKRQTLPPVFRAGANSYWRGAVLMVEITPGNFVNAEVARGMGVAAIKPPKQEASRERVTRTERPDAGQRFVWGKFFARIDRR
jgi:hypothetical protein